MANKPKLTAEYFPHYAAQKKTVPVLKAAFGSHGYSFWYQLLEMLCAAQGHFIDCKINGEFEFMASEMCIPIEVAEQVLAKLIERGKIDRELWETSRIIWCQGLVDNLMATLYTKRTTAPEKPKPERKSDFRDGNRHSRDGNTHSRDGNFHEDEDPDSDIEKGFPGRKSPFPENQSDSRDGNAHFRGIRTGSKVKGSEVKEREVESAPEPENQPLPDLGNLKPSRTHRQPRSMAVTRYQEITGKWPNAIQIQAIDEAVITDADVDTWEIVIKTWLMRGFSPMGVEGMLDWFRTRIPPRKGKPAAKQDYDDESKWDEYREIEKRQKERLQSEEAAKEQKGD